MMARSRDVMILAALMTGAAMASGSASPARIVSESGAPILPTQYFHEERQGYQPAPRYYQPPPPRQTCWTEYRRVLVGYDRYGQPIYRNSPRRVCGYR